MTHPAPNRIAGLDGLRALSIAMVLGGHLAGTRYCYSQSFYSHFGDLANLGVRIFFVISGFLITSLLLKEMERTRTISLTQFYFRRTLRIFPAFYIFVLCIAGLQAAGAISLNRSDLLHAFTYTMNYHPGRAWWLGHIWSLSVEEQFYLLWPAVLLFLGQRRALWAVLTVLALAPIVRIAIVYLLPSDIATIGESFPTIADAIASGCLLALMFQKLRCMRWFKCLMHSPLFFLVPLGAVLLNKVSQGRLGFLIYETLINLALTLCVAYAISAGEGMTWRLLNSGPLVNVGLLSYSLYLWQQPFLDRTSTHWVSAFPINLLFTFAAASVSYVFIEKPFLSLRSMRKTRPLVSRTQEVRPVTVEQ
jgi:peptidoglycan/LPS O-acetylase OafA/YrhL